MINRRRLLSAGGELAGLGAVGAILSATGMGMSAQAAPAAQRPRRLIAMEEACVPSGLMKEWQETLGGSYPGSSKQLLQDVTGKRLEEMDQGGIDIAALSVSVPSPQFVSNREKAEGMARRANDALAKEIAKRPDRFIGFASLSMHDPAEANRELERAVRDLGMRGAILYGFQRADNDDGAWFYDDPRFQTFWATIEALDVPLYLHPGLLDGDLANRERDLRDFPWLNDAAWAFGLHTGRHALRIITSGLFDRHPKVQMLLGHNGEHVVNDIWRVDNWLQRYDTMGFPQKVPAKRRVRDYLKSNVHVTTSGQFTTPGLRHVIEEIGADRVMFAVDYPYESNAAATEWFWSVELDTSIQAAVGWENAARLLKLG